MSITLYATLVGSILLYETEHPNRASDTVAFHPPLSHYKTHLSSLQMMPGEFGLLSDWVKHLSESPMTKKMFFTNEQMVIVVSV